MILDVHVSGKTVAKLYRERDEYVLKYLPGTAAEDFVSLALPVREAPWRWPRDLFPFFRQNLPEGYLLGVIRKEFGALLDGTDLSLLAVIGGAGIGRVTLCHWVSQRCAPVFTSLRARTTQHPTWASTSFTPCACRAGM
jgi:serine/threonine-protein kinase HipA